MLKSLKAGFTLLELLVVIALLGVIIVAVLAAINPIELANRARDTRFTTDASSLVSAINRYYTINFEFPWVTSGDTASNEDAFGFVTAGSRSVGICTDSCEKDGLLITSNELKSEFRNKSFIKDNKTNDNRKTMMVGKTEGAAGSVYACFVPLARATRQKACAEGNVYTLSTTEATRIEVPSVSCEETAPDWSKLGWYVCLPS